MEEIKDTQAPLSGSHDEDVKSGADVLFMCKGNVTHAARYMGVSNLTIRKHRDAGTLDHLIRFNGGTYRRIA